MSMTEVDSEISLYRGKQILKSESDLRVSEDAAKALNSDFEEYGREIAEKALSLAEADGRKTVRGKDIKKALRQLE